MIKLKVELWNRRVLMRREVMLRMALEGKPKLPLKHTPQRVESFRKLTTQSDKINSIIALIIEFVNRGAIYLRS